MTRTWDTPSESTARSSDGWQVRETLSGRFYVVTPGGEIVLDHRGVEPIFPTLEATMAYVDTRWP